MPLSNDELETLIYGSGPGRRFTQDSPVMPDVWLEYGRTSDRVDLLLTPQIGTSTAALAQLVNAEASSARVASSDTYVVAALTFEELVTVVLPLTYWRREQILDQSRAAPQIKWLNAVVERILRARGVKAPKKAATKLLDQKPGPNAEDDETPLVWQVSRNRPAELAIWASRPAVKADAAVQLFSIDCGSIAWAVIDSGIDARHPGLSKRGDDGNLPEPDQALSQSRVVATYDFTKLRTHLAPDDPPDATLSASDRTIVQTLRNDLQTGRSIDWAGIEQVLRVPHDPATTRRRRSSTEPTSRGS